MLDGNSFLEIAAVLSLATLLGIVGQRLRQPLLIMFLATGILAGPSWLGIIQSYHEIELLAHMGIALLLFIVGLKLDLGLIRTTGPVALATGLGQIVFTSAIGFLIALALDIPPVDAAYVAVALTFSSTIIIVKLLSDKKEIDSLHGQIAIGFLIVQDIAAILALVALTTFGSPIAAGQSAWTGSLLIAAKGLGLLAFAALMTRYVLPGLALRLAYSQELLILFAIAWAVCLGAGGEWLGFSKEVGAFLAGVSLASTDYRDAIGARLTSLRDFLLLFFFIDLGARLEWTMVGSQVGAAGLFSVFVLVGNPLIVLAIMGFMGYRRRTAFLAGLTVAQISEFSLIVAALGLSIGHIAPETMGLITLVGVVTIFVSTYMILYSGSLYHLLSKPLKVFERRTPFRECAVDSLEGAPQLDVILVGLGTYGRGIAECLLRRRKTLLGVDFDPQVLRTWRSRGVPVLYGDMTDPELHEHLPLNKARWVVSTVRSRHLDLELLHHLRDRGVEAKVAVSAANEAEADLFKQEGAHVVFRPFADAAEQAADALTRSMEMLPKNIDWPIAFQEIRIRSGASAAGKTIKDIPLRSQTGVSVLAVSRAGRVLYEPGPDFQVYPGDRLVVMGPPDELQEAEAMLDQPVEDLDGERTDRFEINEIRIGENSELGGRTLAELQFRQKYEATVIGIIRGGQRITALRTTERLQPGDGLVVIGAAEAVKGLKGMEPL
ncbi:cation:proton antiporter domain-containing protein [Desulfatiglans anilini]|uniref:cation:proton antiporter domain-containing protein n=1 Tax=Desulfatiglans anilini TaxID=90728 RepID=UPI0004231582|nr:cation:proton antiporter [Desulfatiglans anilini]